MENVVYMLTNKINGKQYIGSTFNLKNRIKYYKYNHKYMTNASLKLDIEKYGFDNFDVQILEQATRDKLRDREKYYIQKYDLINNGYNMTEATKPKDLITEYNKKMCFLGDAQKWTGLKDIDSFTLESGESKILDGDEVIKGYLFATSVTFSYEANDYRYITYADGLYDDGSINVKYNRILA